MLPIFPTMKLKALYTSVLLIGTLSTESAAQARIARVSRCSRDDHQKCIALADPLLKDPHLIFPDNMKDIDMVCRTWSSFVDCIKTYIDGCFTKQRQEQFNSAVELPIASIHQMCSVSTYQSEYLQYATCLKATVIDAEHCGNQYAALVEEVSKGEMARTSLCCSHYHFRSCVILETKEKCDESESAGAATRFSRQVLDKALSFLQDQCQNYIPNNADCPNSVTDSSLSLSVNPIDNSLGNRQEIRGRPYLRTVSPDNYAGQASTFHGASTNAAHPSAFRSSGRALYTFPTTEPENDSFDNRASSTVLSTDVESRKSFTTQQPTPQPTTSTEANRNVEVEPTTRTTEVQVHEEQAVVVTQRPLNYGRGMAWTSPSAKPSSEIPAWATSTWLTSNQMPVTEESMFPAAGSFGGNSIDEPNQQGLSENGQASLKPEIFYVTWLSLVLYFW